MLCILFHCRKWLNALLDALITDRERYENSNEKVTIQQGCAFTALTVRKHRMAGNGIFARDCEGTEQLQFQIEKER